MEPRTLSRLKGAAISPPPLIVWTLLLLLLVDRAAASITVYDEKNATVSNIDDTSANFGPSISDDGFLGYIAIAKPISACSPIEPPPKNVSYVDPRQWIALVLRTPSATGNCSFDLKVYNAQKAGFAAVIVFNSESDNLIKMSSSGLYNIKIPSVFVGHSSGLELAHYYTYENRTYVIINNDDNDFNYLMVPFIIVISICFFVAIVLFIVKFAIHCHKMRKNRFPKSELKKIPTKKYQKTDKYDTCPICLNEYEEGVKMRILPCEHAYHVECIDKWLLRNNRFCPVCKRRVLPGGPDSDSEENSESTHATPSHSGLHSEQHLDIEANEDEDTNESSRLLVRTVRSRASPTDPASTGANDEAASLANLGSEQQQRSSNNLNGSLNNQIMTTSGSNQVTTGAEQLKQSSSRYGSICSVNSLTRGREGGAEATAGASQVYETNEAVVDDDDDEDDAYEKQLKSNNRVILINEAKRKKEGGGAVASGKETPEFFTPRSVTSESSAVVSSSSFTPAQTDKELKLKTYTNKKAKKSKAKAKAGEQATTSAAATAASTVSETTGSNRGSNKSLPKRKKSNKVDVVPAEPADSEPASSAASPANEPAEETEQCTNINFAYDRQNDDDDDNQTTGDGKNDPVC